MNLEQTSRIKRQLFILITIITPLIIALGFMHNTYWLGPGLIFLCFALVGSVRLAPQSNNIPLHTNPEEDGIAVDIMDKKQMITALQQSQQRYDNRIRTKSGDIIWIESSGIAKMAEGVEQAAEAVVMTTTDGIIE